MRAPRNPNLVGIRDGKILILGAGAMGRLWAASLPMGTARFLRRSDSVASDCPFYFQPMEGKRRAVTITYCDPADVVDVRLLLVTTKAPATLTALHEQLAGLHPSIPIVLFQNGLGSQQEVAQRWPHRPILAASTTEAANRPSPDTTVHAGIGHTWIGALTPLGNACLQEVIQQLSQSRLTVSAEADIQSRLWQKLVINAGINPFTALLDCPNGEILNHPLYGQCIDPLCEELHQLMVAEGLDAPPATELRASIESVARATANNTSSMRSDVLNGQLTEIDYINGYVARRGGELGLEMPVNRMLTDSVKMLSNDYRQR
ncbi:ketopantoate reductase family protein [Marinobacter sp. SS21]|uniref:ketopantoate reductase family protein n=1 Tax=Marinobacter sp. SS21 TaxID=2979460 RepID=UPI002330CF27|nr:2-dehydropantoate 2-reductase [Marinobacter sp. SS21]MDC0663927.1 2-dehydropantoate 2-reductase [Marinobacter sp. SS21]